MAATAEYDALVAMPGFRKMTPPCKPQQYNYRTKMVAFITSANDPVMQARYQAAPGSPAALFQIALAQIVADRGLALAANGVATAFARLLDEEENADYDEY